MSNLRLTKNELRNQQKNLQQLHRYLPTLQLKKSLLQIEVQKAKEETRQCKRKLVEAKKKLQELSVFSHYDLGFHPEQALSNPKVTTKEENIAGVAFENLEECTFARANYSLYDSPPALDPLIERLREFRRLEILRDFLEKKLFALENELRQVSIRVNLFEKILIPRAKANIRKIRVFLGDQELAAVARAKVAKTLIERAQAKKGQELYAH